MGKTFRKSAVAVLLAMSLLAAMMAGVTASAESDQFITGFAPGNLFVDDDGHYYSELREFENSKALSAIKIYINQVSGTQGGLAVLGEDTTRYDDDVVSGSETTLSLNSLPSGNNGLYFGFDTTNTYISGQIVFVAVDGDEQAFNFYYSPLPIGSGYTSNNPNPPTDGDYPTLTDTATGVSVYGDFDPEAILSVTPITSGANFAMADTALKDTADKFTLLDINLLKAGVKIQPYGSVSVSIPLPEGFDPDVIPKVYRIEADGTKTDMNAIIFATGVNEYRVGFETDHFSLYAVAQLKTEGETGTEPPASTKPTDTTGAGDTATTGTTNADTNNPKTGDDSLPLGIWLAVMVLSAGVAGTLLVTGRKKKSYR
jgi:LPXTG-motif cell wall-anchored protein